MKNRKRNASMFATKKQRGITIVLVAVFIVVLFAFAALAVDLGVLYTARTSAQHAADAAALAGAYTFLTPGVIQPTAATTAAITVAGQNSILGQPVVITAANVLVDEPKRRVTVTVPRTGANGIETFFAKVIGWTSVDVQTRATAEAAQEGSASRCLKPVFIPNTILADPAVFDPPETTCTQAPANRQVIFDPATKEFSPWFLANAASKYGIQMKVRPSNPETALAPGQFYSLDFGTGADTYRCAWGQCLNYCEVDTTAVVCGEPYPLKTGNMVGPTKQGVGDLVGDPKDTYGVRDSSTGLYTFYLGGDTSKPSSTSRAVVVAPVWDNCSQSISPGYHGQEVTVAGFLTMFVEGTDGQDVVARLLSATECPAPGGGSGGGTGGGNPVTGPLGIPVRLVQTPTT
ncbi:MAG TPA: pilus assembly protein TadG-related protein [Terriglobales bacterium]|nr:pilus assembly protein TadG-related protein [Terriglobales bacterium]